jgi:uncharacterized membrane protein YdjX (TVP38/TMEM64 family)
MTATPEPEVPRAGLGGWVKLALLVALVACGFMLVRWTGAAEYATIANLRALREQAGALAPLGFVLAYVVGAVVAFPAVILSLAGGLMFGTLAGGLLILVGASIGAVLAFVISRRAGRATVERLTARGAVGRLDASISGSGASAVIFTRLVPVLPYNVLNYVWGLTGVSLRDYVVGTVVGMAPASFVYANIGGAISRSLGPETSLAALDYAKLVNRDILTAFGLLGLLVVVPTAIRVIRSRRSSPRS